MKKSRKHFNIQYFITLTICFFLTVAFTNKNEINVVDSPQTTDLYVFGNQVKCRHQNNLRVGLSPSKTDLYSADLREILIQDEYVQNFSGAINYKMPKRDFLFVFDSRSEHQSINRDYYSFEIFNIEGEPIGFLGFRFNDDNFLYIVEMSVNFERITDARERFNMIELFFEDILGKSLNPEQFAKKFNITNSNFSDNAEYEFWLFEEVVVGLELQNKKTRNNENYYSITFGIAPLP